MSFVAVPTFRIDDRGMLSLPNRTLERSSASIASLELGRQEGSAFARSVLAHPAREVWAHLWRTQLLELIGNTLALLAGVGTLVVDAGLAWLVVIYRFPGRAVLEWALVLPLAVPAYVIGFAFLGLFDFTGPVQGALRRWTGTGVRLPELRSYWGVVLMMTLVFYRSGSIPSRSSRRGSSRSSSSSASRPGATDASSRDPVVRGGARPPGQIRRQRRCYASFHDAR